MPASSPSSAAHLWVAGSDAPEKPELNLGFLPLSDAASLIVAATQGFGEPHGLTLHLHRQPSWSALRDNLLGGRLDAAHSLYGLVYGIQLGLGGAPATDMAVLMGLAQNGQSINLARSLALAGVRDIASFVARVRDPRAQPLTLAHTFPTGTHIFWLYYWLAAQGIHPLRDVRTVLVPPPQMPEHLAAGRVDGYCVGEPWGAAAVAGEQGFTLTTSQAIWPDHPEKVLTCTRAFTERYPNTARALIRTLLDASRFIEENPENRASTAQLISGAAYVNAEPALVAERFLGRYQDGLDHQWEDAHPLAFHRHGAVNPPYLSDGLWFLTQFRRWGLLREEPDYLAIAEAVQCTALYRDAATSLGLEVPATRRHSVLLDGRAWDGSDPAGYARSFDLHALADQ
ncbi:CmpA/NrtA family ABC transporter substrate-binding protein [Pseudomonas sp. EpS/L25]|uniref:CmpA/NrtA family ABC transporter substrate-binding protein n=1 Tax=Pseudomonas sp. EpS/L25 TaxID=1749078 RepID=UPI0007435AB9|nr:CmpA/NrtA family ABC transporter substrate-binding protein [Pseudomonas sp. EpS/L25]KUM44534.1 nitrate transporter [Pseudomonas sp. EpS/L25]